MGRPQGSQSLIVTTFRLPFTTHKKVMMVKIIDDGDDGNGGDNGNILDHGNGVYDGDDGEDGDDGDHNHELDQDGEAVSRTESRDEWAR